MVSGNIDNVFEMLWNMALWRLVSYQVFDIWWVESLSEIDESNILSYAVNKQCLTATKMSLVTIE